MEQKVIETRLELSWYFIFIYLDMISKIGTVSGDEGFKNKLKDLENYVFEKLPLKGDGDVFDVYVTVLQKPEV